MSLKGQVQQNGPERKKKGDFREASICTGPEAQMKVGRARARLEPRVRDGGGGVGAGRDR